MNEKEILEKAVTTFGVNAQLDMAIEECSELINALCKFRRHRVSDKEVVTEIADVQIMMRQMAFMFGEDEVEEERKRKIERLERRLQEHNINAR